MTAPSLGRSVLLLATSLVLSGCFGFGSVDPERVEDPSIVAFAERIDRFYTSFEDIPLDIRATFDDPERRQFFDSEEDFASYYASLAAGARRALLRNSTPRQVVIDEFRFDGVGTATVDVRFVGDHVRQLRIGDVEIPRTDRWQRVDGRWILSPDKL